MEGETLTTNNFISSVKKFHSDTNGHGTINTLLKNFLSETSNMAIKENLRHTDKYVYTIPVTTGSQVSDRMTSISEAKRAFLNSTVESQPNTYPSLKKEEPVLHYAQLAMVTESEDSRSTGGGKAVRRVNSLKNKHKESPTSVKSIEQRKVSFKIKSVSSSHRKPPIATKTMIITNNKVSELTQKFNNLTESSPNRQVRQPKSIKLVEEKSVSSNSNPSSPLSSSPNIKIILRQKRGSKRRNNKKRCSSVDEIDKLVSMESSSKTRVNRSKSDGTKIPKTPKKRLKYDSSGQNSGTDSVDGTPSKTIQTSSAKINQKPENSVKDVIKKFETEIKTLPRPNQSFEKVKQSSETKKVTVNLPKEKPKVPEKKSSLALTKNLVVKDGVPKIKSIRPIAVSPQKEVTVEKEQSGINKKREPLYDKLKYKTNYIHSEKLPLKIVEIIQEESSKTENDTSHTETEIIEQEIVNEHNEEDMKATQKIEENQHISKDITANDSFLWRRKSHNYSDIEKSIADGSYSLISLATSEYPIEVSDNNESSTFASKQSQVKERVESPSIYEPNSTVINIECNTNSADFESNLVEAVNKEVVKGFTSNNLEESEFEDGYEPLEPKDFENVVIIPVKSFDKNIKANCPLPEIPKQVVTAPPSNTTKDNVYQCLLEMRSLPEGDESCMHNYEDCDTKLEERTRGDGDSDDGYEYCKAPIKPFCITSSSGIQIAENYNPATDGDITKNYGITKSVSSASTVSYEKIGSDRIYEKIPLRPPKSKDSSPSSCSNRNSLMSDYTAYNDGENIYDTIKQGDAVSLSHCYESIPNSPSMVKMRQSMRKTLASSVQKRLSFDNVSNISLSTLSSEQKTNSIYGQRSVVNYNGQEIAFPVPTSESGSSDRSDDWVDISDDEKNDEQKIIIVQERGRGRKSPISWSQKVRHQWHKKPKQKTDEKVSVSSPTNVYIQTSEKSPYYSVNDECVVTVEDKVLYENGAVQEPVEVYDEPELPNWLSVRTRQRHGDVEVQDLIAFLECESSDSGHVYESLEPAPSPPAPAPLPLDDDFDSFDSDTDDDDKATYNRPAPPLPASRLPEPPSGNHTLTKIANAAQKKMRQIKRNLTKRYSVALDGNPFRSTSNNQNGTYDVAKKTKSAIYSDYEKPEIQHIYSNISFNDTRSVLNKTEIPPTKNGFKEELKSIIGEKRASNGDIPSPLSEKPHNEKPVTPTSEGSKKGSETLSRKTYFSFKSRFRRATSMAVDINTDVPSALKITNSTFYLTDSMDGDSGFSNCSDNGNTSTEAPTAPRRQNGKLRHAWSESSPCLALERPSCPPPPPPIVASPQPVTSHEPQLSAVNEELKRLLPTLSRKEKSPRARTSWYADCDSSAGTSEWYSENGVYQAGNISTSSGASSASHPASPLPHSLFTHEPLYQFYNAAKVESVCRDDSDSEAYESPAARARPSAMALVAPRGPQRTLWCEVPEVLASTVLSSLAPAQKRLQEAKFELLTSEASYLNSLNVLEAHFVAHPAFRDTNLLPRADWETLFGTILPVKRCSQLLMNELEKCWQDNILLTGICEIVRAHAEEHFHVYVKYCENQALMVKALQRLREKPAFAAALKRLESHPACQSLSLHSFLMLPMQRVTRLPLLLDAVLKNLSSQDAEYDACMHALATLNSFVSQCNEGARNTERIEEMYRISQCIEFPASMENAPVLGPACSRRDKRPVRWLVRSGEMTHLVWKADEMKLTFGKKFHKIPLHLFLFNDLLVITKKKGENFIAVDYCPRSLLEVCASDNTAGVKRALLLTLLENSHAKTVELLLSCASETDVSRWVEALAPAESGSGDAVYAGWDCPQVVAVFAYCATQPDELALAEGDVVNVARKTSEGWYYGERTRDGMEGWFPGAYTAEVMSAHVRARNLRQRYRLLALSATYLGQRKA